ncbi:hypothetical protein FRB90_004319 [Tulasnella sp. 427]|nr:hypothetical protein FRB90_004319 [Tulasnella sp. 427]
MAQVSFDVSLDKCLTTLKTIDTTSQIDQDVYSQHLEIADQDRQHCLDFHSWIKTHNPQALAGLAMAECPMAKRAISSVPQQPCVSTPSSSSHDETASILKFRSFLQAARKHAASTAAASAACTSESEESATNSRSSSTDDTESSDSDDEISDNEAEQLAARARSRCRRSASASKSATTTAGAHIPPPSPAPQPHIDPEGFWLRREYEWSWTPESPSTSIKLVVPSIVLTPAPANDENTFDALAYTRVWTPLQSTYCPITSRSLLTVPECFVLRSDIPMHQPECVACAEPTQLKFRTACENELGMTADELTTLCVDEQRRRGLHGKMWSSYVGTCVCAEWKAYNLACKANEEELAAQETETSSEEEDSPVSSPGMPCTPLTSAMELEESGEDKPQGPRWMDLDDDDELPSLDDWT